MRTIIGITGASGSNFAVNFIQKCPSEKFLVATKWGKRVMMEELGLKFEEISSMVDNTFADHDLASPFASGSNYFDSLVIETHTWPVTIERRRNTHTICA